MIPYFPGDSSSDSRSRRCGEINSKGFSGAKPIQSSCPIGVADGSPVLKIIGNFYLVALSRLGVPRYGELAGSQVCPGGVQAVKSIVWISSIPAFFQVRTGVAIRVQAGLSIGVVDRPEMLNFPGVNKAIPIEIKIDRLCLQQSGTYQTCKKAGGERARFGERSDFHSERGWDGVGILPGQGLLLNKSKITTLPD